MHCGSIHLVSSISGAHVSVYWAPTQPLPTPEIPQQASSSSQIPSMHQDASPNLRSIRYRACDVVAVIYGDDTRVAQLKDAICSVLLSNSGEEKTAHDSEKRPWPREHQPAFTWRRWHRWKGSYVQSTQTHTDPSAFKWRYLPSEINSPCLLQKRG